MWARLLVRINPAIESRVILIVWLGLTTLLVVEWVGLWIN